MIDTWIFLTYGNGTKYINECDNKTRSASIMFICGQDSVRRESFTTSFLSDISENKFKWRFEGKGLKEDYFNKLKSLCQSRMKNLSSDVHASSKAVCLEL